MHDTGCLGLVHWDDPEGWYGEGGGFRMGNTCIPVADSFQYFANQYNTVKFKNKIKFKKNSKTHSLNRASIRASYSKDVGIIRLGIYINYN